VAAKNFQRGAGISDGIKKLWAFLKIQKIKNQLFIFIYMIIFFVLFIINILLYH